MNAPDQFALGGRQDDAELIEAKRHILALMPAFCARETTDDERNRLCHEIYEEVERINAIPPKTLLGAAVKLWLLASPDIGMEAGERDDDFVSLRQVAEFMGRLTGGAAP